MLATHSVGSSSLLISSRLSRGLSSSFNSTFTATGTRKGGITTGDTSSSTSKCSLTASHLAHGRILNTSAYSDRTISSVRPFNIVHFCALRLSQNPLRATCQSVGCPDAELPPGAFYARFSPEEWCKLNTSTTTSNFSVYSTLFLGFRTGAMTMPNTLSLALEQVTSFRIVFWISASAGK